MSGKRNKKLRREFQDDKIERNIRIRQLESLPYIPADAIAAYLSEKFRGKAGYHYISISKLGSLFINPEYANIVPIMMHRNRPSLSAMGKFTDGNNKELAIGLVKVTDTFPGLVIDRYRNVYLGGELTPVDTDPTTPVNPLICNFERVTVDECNNAIRSQEEIYSKRIKDLIERTEKRMKSIMNPPTPYEENPYVENPYEEMFTVETVESLDGSIIDSQEKTETQGDSNGSEQ